MTVVFIAGSITIKNLHSSFVERMAKVISENYLIVVGDADGADLSIQSTLADLKAKNVTVYCSGSSPRNNVGAWEVKNIHSNAKEGTRSYFTAKDLEMAKIADYGLMIWDAKSTGTLNNIIELLRKEKKSLVFLNKNKTFVTVSSTDKLRDLIDNMSEGARQMAEQKISLSEKLHALEHKQFSIPL